MPDKTFHLDEFSINLTGMIFPVFFVLLIIFTVFSIWYYTRTVPDVKGGIKWLLISLRALVLALLLFSIAKPLLNMIYTTVNKPKTAVLIDTSSSMDQKADPARKASAVDAFNKIRSSLGNGGVFFTFDNKIRKFENSPPEFTGSGTDISSALKKAFGTSGVNSAIIISDGAWNLGEDPAEMKKPPGIPVYTVTVGSKSVFIDKSIKNISAPPVVRDGETLPIEISIISSKPDNDVFKTEITENGKLLTSGEASFDNTDRTILNMEVPVKSVGNHEFKISIKPSKDDNPENNTRILLISAVKSSFNILIAAGEPSPDFAFLSRTLESEKAFKVEKVIRKSVSWQFKSSFPDDLKNFDVIIIIDWAGGMINNGAAEQIKNRVSSGAGVWFLGSAGISGVNAELLKILPVMFSGQAGISDSLLYVESTASGKTHFITSGFSGGSFNWRELPPLLSILPAGKTSVESGVLLTATLPSKRIILPALITGKFGGGKIVLTPFSGLWRWMLMMEGAGKDVAFYKNFTSGIVNWLVSDTGISPLKITTDETSYLSGQEINFEGRIYDNAYSPVSGAEINIEFDNLSGSKILLTETQPYVYKGKTGGLPSGEHIYKASAYVSGNRFAETTGKITVRNFSLEMLDTSSNPETMGKIASQTGGLTVTPDGIDSVLTKISNQKTTERYENKSDLHLNPVILFLIILFLVCEWSIRKFRGMI